MLGDQPPPVRCVECGASIPQHELRTHVCDWHDWLDYQVLARREELGRIEEDLGAFLASPRGRFELWYAERERGV